MAATNSITRPADQGVQKLITQNNIKSRSRLPKPNRAPTEPDKIRTLLKQANGSDKFNNPPRRSGRAKAVIIGELTEEEEREYCIINLLLSDKEKYVRLS